MERAKHTKKFLKKRSITEGRINTGENKEKKIFRKGKDEGKLTKNTYGNWEVPKPYMAKLKDDYRSLMQGNLEMDFMDPRAKEAEPITRVGLVNPANGGPTDPDPGTDPIRGEITPYPKQTHRDEGSSRASRARNWKRRAREANEPQLITTGKGDVGKRRADGHRWDETVGEKQDGSVKVF
ncbi:hypothetical protein U1Q18_001241 [Sarracenia purpurea var. burkii]